MTNTFILFKKIQSFFSAICILAVLLSSCSTLNSNSHSAKKWVGTWSTAPQLVEPGNVPPAPGLTNNSLRQIVRVSIGSDSLRIRFSNAFSTSAVTLKAVKIAVSTGGNTIDAASSKELKFSGKTEVTMTPGAMITSDPIVFDLKSRMDLAITIYFAETCPNITGHPGSRTTSYLLAGNNTSVNDFTGSIPTDHWYIINGIEVKAPTTGGAVAILGNSITDGRGSGINKQNRWPDILSERLLKNAGTQQVGVLNLGIGGNCVLKNCLGPSGVSRFSRDILKQQGIRWFIIAEGINDIGQIPDQATGDKIAQDLIAAYKQMIADAHAQGIKVYGATIMPFKKSFYDAEYRQTARTTVNEWIRTSGSFDAVIDFNKAMRDPNDTLTILPTSHTGDFLHPNEAGYVLMGEAVDLKLFE
jgi:lysophospholipase L1-like esterase